MKTMALTLSFLLTFIFIMPLSSVAQIPGINHQLKQQMLEQKAIHYKQMMLCEQQITPNQNDYDITYYALDLTPDPVTAQLIRPKGTATLPSCPA